TTVGNAALLPAIAGTNGAPTVTVVPVGPTTTRSLALTVAKFTGWLNVTWRKAGAWATAWPEPGTTDETRRTLTKARAASAWTSPKPPSACQVPAWAPLSGVAEAMNACVISAGVAAGSSCFIRAAIAARLGAAEDVPVKLGRFWLWFVPVTGSLGK